MKEVLVFMADGTEEIEALTVVDLLRRVNIPVSMVSVNDAEYVTGSHAITIKMDMGISAVNLENVGMIVLPGGMPGTNKLMDSEKLTKMIHTFAEEGKYLAVLYVSQDLLTDMSGIYVDQQYVYCPDHQYCFKHTDNHTQQLIKGMYNRQLCHNLRRKENQAQKPMYDGHRHQQNNCYYQTGNILFKIACNSCTNQCDQYADYQQGYKRNNFLYHPMFKAFHYSPN